MTMTAEVAALRVLALITSPLLDSGGHDDAYEALAAADKHMQSLSTGERELLGIAWSLFSGDHPLGRVDADNASAVLQVLAARYAPSLTFIQPVTPTL